MDGTALEMKIPDAARAGKKRAGLLFRAAGRHPLMTEFALTFAAFFGRFLFYGWRYFTQSGDYAALHNRAAYYSLQSDTVWQYLARSGSLTGTPLAALSDVYLWSAFFDRLILLLLIFSLMYAAASVIFRYVFGRLFGTGYFFPVVFCLFPFAMEGQYVLSAASQISVALFFASLSALLIYKLKEEGKLRYLPLFTLTQLLTFGFHEGAAMLSAAVCAVVALKNRSKYSLCALMIAANLCVYAIYLQLGSMMFDTYDAGQSMTAANGYYADVFLPASQKLGAALSAFSPAAVFGSAGRGFGTAFKGAGFVFLAAAACLAAVIAVLIFRAGAKGCEKPGAKNAVGALSCGLLFSAAGLLPVFVGRAGSLSGADFVPAICGAAVILDLALRAVCRGRRAIFVPVVTAVFIVFCAAGVSELRDYRAVSEADRKTAAALIEIIDDSFDRGVVDESSSVGVLNIKSGEQVERGLDEAGHIRSAASDTTEFTEMLRALSGNGRFPTVTALPVDGDGYFYYSKDGDGKRVENFDHIFVATDYAMIRVIPARGFTDGDYDPRANYVNYLLYTVDFTRLAHVSEYAGYGIFKFY